MLEEIDKIYHFIKRDVLSFATYKTNLVLILLSSTFGALSYAYLGSNASMQSVLQTYHMSLLTYLVIGMAFSQYVYQSMTVVQNAINPWWLEEVFVSPTRLLTFVVGSSAWGFILSTITLVIYLGIGSTAFGMALNINLLGTLVVLILGIGTSVGLSMLGSAVQLVTKKGDPVTWTVGMLTVLFGNVMFPPQVLPSYLQVISRFVPQYYFYTSIRLVMSGWSLQSILSDVLALALMCSVMLIVGYVSFSYCLRIIKKNGTLSWF